MSDTPRTDAIALPWSSQQAYVAMVDLARQLERELAEAQAEIDRKLSPEIYRALMVDFRESRAYAERLLRLIEEHNSGCSEACTARTHCDAYRDRKLWCPDCPEDWKIEIPDALAKNPAEAAPASSGRDTSEAERPGHAPASAGPDSALTVACPADAGPQCCGHPAECAAALQGGKP